MIILFIFVHGVDGWAPEEKRRVSQETEDGNPLFPEISMTEEQLRVNTETASILSKHKICDAGSTPSIPENIFNRVFLYILFDSSGQNSGVNLLSQGSSLIKGNHNYVSTPVLKQRSVSMDGP